MKRDLIITWPKKLHLEDYLRTCREAETQNLVINYRVAKSPTFDFGAFRERPGRVYVVHDGAVRGYQELLYITYREDNEVLDPRTKGFWPKGTYLVRAPHWYPIEPIPMRGFQGWRYFQTEN